MRCRRPRSSCLRISTHPFFAELSQRTSFVNPFIIACGTRNVKFTGIAVVCLQRLIAAKGVPPTRLDQVLQAIRESSAGGLDVQLRILQSLPTLLQNYADEVSGDLLITTLNICFVLQASKNVVVNNTASATLQQLLISVFDKVVAEDSETSCSQKGDGVNGFSNCPPLQNHPLRHHQSAKHRCKMGEYHCMPLQWMPTLYSTTYAS